MFTSIAVSASVLSIVINPPHFSQIFLFSNFSGNFDESVENYLRSHGIPYLQGTQEALTAVQALENYAKKRKLPPRTEVVNPVSDAVRSEWKQRFAGLDRPLTETESRELLNAYGIRGPQEKTAGTAEEAVRSAILW